MVEIEELQTATFLNELKCVAMGKGMAYRFNKPKYACQVSLDIQNIANHKNVSNVNYNPSTNGLENTYGGSALTPLLGVSFDF